MDTTAHPPELDRSEQPEPVTFDRLFEILSQCAWKALVATWMVILLGDIALHLAGGVWHKMTPSLPPGLAHEAPAEVKPARASGAWKTIRSSCRPRRFAILFGLLFVGGSAARLAASSRHPGLQRLSARLRVVLDRGFAEWFHLLVVNAFLALGTAMALRFLAQFSLTQYFWHFFLQLLKPLFDALAKLAPSGDGLHWVTDWWSWYDHNQLKFTFWMIYAALICDDLGLPCLKTWGRWLRRRLRRRRRGALLPSRQAPPA